VPDFYQALYQDRDFFERHGITHVRSTYLYFTPCDENGNPVVVGDANGNAVDGYVSAGGYHSAADAYDTGNLTPTTVRRPPSP
jgi:uncharacterized protein RhaS with RHS repeats